MRVTPGQLPRGTHAALLPHVSGDAARFRFRCCTRFASPSSGNSGHVTAPCSHTTKGTRHHVVFECPGGRWRLGGRAGEREGYRDRRIVEGVKLRRESGWRGAAVCASEFAYRGRGVDTHLLAQLQLALHGTPAPLRVILDALRDLVKFLEADAASTDFVLTMGGTASRGLGRADTFTSPASLQLRSPGPWPSIYGTRAVTVHTSVDFPPHQVPRDDTNNPRQSGIQDWSTLHVPQTTAFVAAATTRSWASEV